MRLSYGDTLDIPWGHTDATQLQKFFESPVGRGYEEMLTKGILDAMQEAVASGCDAHKAGIAHGLKLSWGTARLLSNSAIAAPQDSEHNA